MEKKKVIKRKVSKITVPLDEVGSKDSMEAFRTTLSIKKRLGKESNKSEVINKALAEYYAKETIQCPTCKGKGHIRK